MEISASAIKLLVLGDSILWGQGLYEQQKIHTRVAHHLELLNPNVRIQTTLLAHSGAIIGDPNYSAPLALPDIPNIGEVPMKTPTVFQQIEQAQALGLNDDTLDVIVLGGGINDVNLATLLNPLDTSLNSRIEDIFYTRLHILLDRVQQHFPNAIPVVTGYYNFFSEQSQRPIVQAALKALGLDQHVLQVVKTLILDSLLTESLIKRFITFHETAHACIRRVLAERRNGVNGQVHHAYFADPAFEDDHAIGAPQSLLYGVDTDLTLEEPDAMVQARTMACEQAAPLLNPAERIACPVASVGHPNPAGAERYAQAILEQIQMADPNRFLTL
jgi:lysophospholipase L1-like esterase